MAAPFPPRANGIARATIVALAVLLAGIPAGLMGWVRTPFHRGQYWPPPQPVAFPHTVHAAEAGIDCRYCHHTVDRTPYAGIPSTELCLGCHRQILAASPRLAGVRMSAESGEPIAWRRVHNLPDHVYFDHAVHVRGGVGCATCHGRVDLMRAVAQVAPLSMTWCLDCHRRPAPHLRPASQITNMAWVPDGEALAATRDVRALVTCTACHR